jgi:hypothetical protein
MRGANPESWKRELRSVQSPNTKNHHRQGSKTWEPVSGDLIEREKEVLENCVEKGKIVILLASQLLLDIEISILSSRVSLEPCRNSDISLHFLLSPLFYLGLYLACALTFHI